MYKKIKILITLNEMQNFFGGVQTFTLTLYNELIKENKFIVDIYTRKKGRNPFYKKFDIPESNIIKEKGVFLNTYKEYDLIICNSKKTLKKIKKIKGKKIFISHGILSKSDLPTKGADIYIAVSEEIQRNIIKEGFSNVKIIRNPINCDYYNYIGCSKKLKNITFLDRRRCFPFINDLKNMNFNIKTIGNPPTNNIKKELSDADLVVARGRGAYEAMALGKNVIISGNNSGRASDEIMDGFITEKTFSKFRENNCSGRYNAIKVNNINIFLNELNKYSQEQGVVNRKLIENNNNIKNIALEIIGDNL